MFEKAEAEYETLTGKKRIVSNDKTKIEKVKYFLTHPFKSLQDKLSQNELLDLKILQQS